MKTAFPIFVLRRQAKELKKSRGIPLSEALDEIAQREGFRSWSLLMSKRRAVYPTQYSETLGFLNPGDLVLVGARPGMGKTSFSIGMFVQAIEEKRPKGFFFTLAMTAPELTERISRYNERVRGDDEVYRLDDSNDICADYIISKAKGRVAPGSLIVVDYLQLLSEKRVNPPLQEQVEQLKRFALESGCILVFICQLDRRLESRSDPRPTVGDIRLPNPLDLGLFNKIILLYREASTPEEVEVSFAGRFDHEFRAGLNVPETRFFDSGSN